MFSHGFVCFRAFQAATGRHIRTRTALITSTVLSVDPCALLRCCDAAWQALLAAGRATAEPCAVNPGAATASNRPFLAAGAPAILPEFLQPSIPTKSNATWRNAEQRAADKAAKAARVAGLPPPAPPPPVRWLRVPQAGEGEGEGAAAPAILPAVLQPGQQERQLTGMEMWLPDIPAAALAGQLGGLRSPQKRAPGPWGLLGSGGGGKKQRLAAAPALDEDGTPLQPAPSHYKATPHSQEARDAKSGKGRKRLFLHPIIRTKDRCGKCSVRGRCCRCCCRLQLEGRAWGLWGRFLAS